MSGSKLDKLQVSGIRSFDNMKAQTIQFYCPLTLIVGANGSGKTTIIECLKYATTGMLPPNSTKGGAFIHDPKLCGEKEVLAQVRLQFEASSRSKMNVVRSLQVTVQKNTLRQKTLEGSLLMSLNGERTAISTKVAELDQLVPQYLGVSRAIIDNVILCHQDESLWPMAEPGTLKKRFDEIFEAERYTKAVDNIKLLRKQQNEGLSKLRLIEQHAKNDRDKGERSAKRCEALSAEIEKTREQISKAEERGDEAEKRFQEASDRAAEFNAIVIKLDNKREEGQFKEENVRELKKYMTPMNDSDHDLKTMNDTYDERVGQLQESIDRQKHQYQDLETEIKECRRNSAAKQGELGRHQAERDSYERQVQHRQEMVKEAASYHNIRGFKHELDDDAIHDFMERVGKMARDQNATFDSARREIQEESQRAQSSISTLNERKSALSQNKEHYRSLISGNDTKILQHRKNLDHILIDEGAKAQLEYQIQDMETNLSQSRSKFNARGWDQTIKDSEAQLQKFESHAEELNEELFKATGMADETAQSNLLKKQLKEAEQALTTMTGAHSDRISSFVGPDWKPHNLESAFQRVTEKHALGVKEAEAQRDGTNRELEQASFRLDSVKSELKRKRKDCQRFELSLKDIMGKTDLEKYPEELETLEYNRDELRKECTQFDGRKDYYEECLAYVKDAKCCKLCAREFDSSKTLSSFETRLKKLMSDKTKDAAAADLEECEKELTNFKAKASDFESWKRLSDDEIPDCDREAGKVEPRCQELESKAERQDDTVKERQNGKDEVESLAKTVQAINKYASEIARLISGVDKLAAKQTQSGSMRDVEQIQADIQQVNEKSRSARSNVAKLNSERDQSRSSMNQLEHDIWNLKSKLSEAMQDLKEKENIDKQIQDLGKASEQHKGSLRQVEKDLETLFPQIGQAQAKLDDIRERGNNKERSLREESSRLSKTVSELQAADRDVNAYVDKNGPAQLARCQKELRNLDNEHERLQTQQRKVTSEVNKLQEQMKNQEKMQRQITDNLRYRGNVRDLETVRAEISSLESQNAEGDRDHWSREAREWQHKRDKAVAERNQLHGTITSKDKELQQNLEDWETFYKDARWRFYEAQVRVLFTKAAADDLGRYGGALDKAIMQYHSLKMGEINRILSELWQQTYQGTDVDTILIRSDNESQKGNRSYNYRVCMVKQDAEMDMRGRCSAGQKVLASILIRLALAECFGLKCGLIALDEPTTNLDRDNIRALASSLHEIIKARKAQKNFELIVITHDEDFLRYMRCQDFCDYYFRVNRNEKQKSVIMRQSIAEVM